MYKFNKKLIVPLVTLTCLSLFSGCGNKTKIVGGEAAKLLVMNERLDSATLKNANFNFNYSNSINKKSKQRDVSSKSKVRDVNVSRGPKLSKTGTTSKKDGNKITWTTFNEYSNAISYFDSFVSSIDEQTKNAAETIDETKERVDGYNVWVKGMSYENLLQVNPEQDLVMRRSNSHYQIISRTINEQGTEVFDVYQREIGLDSETRVRKVGDYRYEYANIQERADFEHYFIADKSRGYWMIQSPGNEHQFSTTVIKEDRVYEYTINVDVNSIDLIKVITADQKCDVLNIMGNYFTIYAGAISNIDHLSIEVNDDEICNMSEYEYDGNSKIKVLYNSDDKEYTVIGKGSADVHLKDGKTLKQGDQFVSGKVEFDKGYVSGNADGPIAELTIRVEGDTLKDRINNFAQFLKEANISFVRDYNSIMDSINVACDDSYAAINSVAWNDVSIETVEKYANARKLEKEKMKYYSSKYEEVKDNTVLSKNQQGTLDKNTKFPYVTSSSFNANYQDNIVTINSSNLKVDDLTLFEQGKKYSVEYALAEFDETSEGYSSLIPIANDKTSTTYSGENQISVNSSNVNFTLPVPQVGNYELVSYIVNEEGIRVTRPQPVKVGDVKNNQISIHNYTAEVSKSSEGLLSVVSKINENLVLEIKDPKASYTYSELYKLLSSEAYNYGVVSKDNMEKLNDASNFVKLNGNENYLTSGTYRLAFTNQNNKVVYVSLSF